MTLWTVLSGHAGDSQRHARSAVLALAAAASLAGCASPSDGDGGQRASLAGSSTETTPGTTPGTTPEPTDAPQIDPAPSGRETPVGGQPWNDQVTDACADTVDAGLEQVAQTASDSSGTSFWVDGKRWAVCDVVLDPQTSDALALTAHTSRRGGPAGFDERRLSLSATVIGDQADPQAVRFSAGGLLPWPVEEITYTFPDGHTEKAGFVASADASGDTWWSVGYTATDGPLVDPGTTSEDLRPVTISIVGAAAEAFRLPWEDVQRTE